MSSVTLSPKALDEYTASALWYHDRGDELGSRFKDYILESLRFIQEHPKTYPKKHDSFREAALKDFPFVIVYDYNETMDLIIVTSIFHANRNPRHKYRSK